MTHCLWNRPDDVVWESRDLWIVVIVPTSVHEDVHIPAMAVHVTREDNSTRVRVWLEAQLVVELHETLGVVDSRMQMATRVLPPPVQIYAHQTRPVVAMDHSIHIENRNQLDDEVLPQGDSCRVVGQEELDAPLDHVLGIAFSRMDSRSEEEELLVLW